jgi:hypothetical protein
MPNELVIYAQAEGSIVMLTLDSGQSLSAAASTRNGRDDAHVLALPDGTRGQGSLLSVTGVDSKTKTVRGIVHPNDDGDALYQFDDFGPLEPATTVPPNPEPEPPPSDDPEGIINEVFAEGGHDLSTHEGCGEFTEDCCTELHERNSQWWGHIRKNPGQNQYNGHAVDALMLATGEGAGIYDIIHDSVAPSASPQYIWKGPPDLDLWYYDDPVSNMRMTVHARGPHAALR